MSRASVLHRRIAWAVIPAAIIILAAVWLPTAAGREPGEPGASHKTQQASLLPFDPVPAFSLPTRSGSLEIPADVVGESAVLIGYSELSTLSQSLWSGALDQLLAMSPRDVHFVFLSYAEDAGQNAADMDSLAARLDSAIAGLADPADQAHWRGHTHLVVGNPLALPEPVPSVLTAWGPVLAEMTATWMDASGAPQSLREIGTTDSGWAASLTETGPISASLGLYGPPTSAEALACPGTEPGEPITGTIALMERGVCPFVDKVTNAAAHGALAALLYTDDREKLTMGGSCTACPEIPAVMIDRQPGLLLSAEVEAGRTVHVTLAPLQIGVELMAIDSAGRARELGNVPYPFNTYLTTAIDDLAMVAYAAQSFHYERERDARLAAEDASGAVTRLTVLADEWADDPGWQGKRSYADVALPPPETMATFDTLEVELALQCPDRTRGNCPAWDYIVDLYLCDGDDPSSCELLIGRWITPYWAEGHWVTDVTPMLGWLSDGGTRRFAFYTQQRYQVDLTLRLSNRGKGLVPKRAIDLGLDGGPFWDRYNERFRPIRFEVPDWAEKVEIASYVTGHGFGKDAANCAEFCNHTHHISVNDLPEHVREHPEVDRELGCAEQVPGGVVPNQGGTWVYGRGGWCPGLDVKPWVIDITGEVSASNTNELTYRALFGGQDYVPEPADPANPEPYDAVIRMRSYMVFWGAVGTPEGPVQPPEPTETLVPTETPVPTETLTPTLGTPTLGTPTLVTPTPSPSATSATPSPATPGPTTTPTATGGPPTVTQTPIGTRTSPPIGTGTPTPRPPTAAPTGPSLPDEACTFLLGRVPLQAISDALANPAAVPGHGLFCNPNVPPGPYNRLRDRLSLVVPGKPYHPLYNGLVWRCGCP